MTISERKHKLEEAEKLACALIDIMRELSNEKPEKYGWNDLDYPLQYMQEDIDRFCYKFFPTNDYGGVDYIRFARKKLSEFEMKRDLFNRMKIQEN